MNAKDFVAWLNSYKPFIEITDTFDVLTTNGRWAHKIETTFITPYSIYDSNLTSIKQNNMNYWNDFLGLFPDTDVELIKNDSVNFSYFDESITRMYIEIIGFNSLYTNFYLVKIISENKLINNKYMFIEKDYINFCRTNKESKDNYLFVSNKYDWDGYDYNYGLDYRKLKLFIANKYSINVDDITDYIPPRLIIDEVVGAEHYTEYSSISEGFFYLFRFKDKYAISKFEGNIKIMVGNMDTLLDFQRKNHVRTIVYPRDYDNRITLYNYFAWNKEYTINSYVLKSLKFYICNNGTLTKTKPETLEHSVNAKFIDNLERVSFCNICNEEFVINSLSVYDEDNDEWYCSDCAKDNSAFYCSQCGQMHYGYEPTIVYDLYYCQDCADNYLVTCEHCGELIQEDDARQDDDCNYYCQDCFDDNFTYCENCGVIIRREDAYNDGEYEYCADCAPDFCRNEKIKEYCYKPIWIKHGASKNNRYFGVEIETDTNNFNDSFECFDEEFDIENNEDYVFAKEDGSISGIEVVTHPATLDEWKTNDLYKDLIQSLSNYYDYKGRHSGIHVHIDRKAFKNDLAIVKLIYIFNKLYSTEIFEFSERRDIDAMRRWASRNPKIIGNSAKSYLRDENSDKYFAVNTLHSSTVEIRVFQSILDYDKIMDILTFCNGLVEATKLTIKDLKDITLSKILELGRV